MEWFPWAGVGVVIVLLLALAAVAKATKGSALFPFEDEGEE